MSFDEMQKVWLRQPGYKRLKRILLAEGGKRVALREEPYLELLLEHGAFKFRSKLRLMEALSCHTNAANLWRITKGRIGIVTGWALSKGGMWRQHSWGWDRKAEVAIETTAARVLYYGVLLDAESSSEFADDEGV